MTAEWLVVGGLLVLGGLWWDGLKTRELAIQAARRICQHAGVQPLDETVNLRRLRPRRNDL